MESDSNFVKIDGRVIDINKANINDLHLIQSKVDKLRPIQVKIAAHRLLYRELGPTQYHELIDNGSIRVIGDDSKVYIVHNTGFIECMGLDGKKKEREAQIYRNGYPAGDLLVTVITYIKHNSKGLHDLWGCGNITLHGGELKSD